MSASHIPVVQTGPILRVRVITRFYAVARWEWWIQVQAQLCGDDRAFEEGIERSAGTEEHI
jgi:hypothetical protein